MNLPEEKQTLASEIIADQEKEIEKLKSELQKLKNEDLSKIDQDKENTMFEMRDCIDKTKYLIDKFMDCYGFNSTKKMGEGDALTFAYNKENMYIELLIICDYIYKAQKTFEILETQEK